MSLVLTAFFVPMLAAYIFLFSFMPSRFYILQQSSLHLILQLIFVGLILLILISPFSNKLIQSFDSLICVTSIKDFVIVVLRKIWIPIYSTLEILNIRSTSSTGGASHTELLKLSSLSLTFSLIFAVFLISIESIFRKKLRPVLDNLFTGIASGNMAQVINHCVYNDKAVLITLKSKKVYIGYLTSALAWGGENRTLSLVPLYSGYRNEKCHLELTNNYESFWGLIKFLNNKKTENESSKVVISEIDDETGEESVITKMTVSRARLVAENTIITFKYEDIEIISEWFSELYQVHGRSDDRVIISNTSEADQT